MHGVGTSLTSRTCTACSLFCPQSSNTAPHIALPNLACNLSHSLAVSAADTLPVLLVPTPLPPSDPRPLRTPPAAPARMMRMPPAGWHGAGLAARRGGDGKGSPFPAALPNAAPAVLLLVVCVGARAGQASCCCFSPLVMTLTVWPITSSSVRTNTPWGCIGSSTSTSATTPCGHFKTDTRTHGHIHSMGYAPCGADSGRACVRACVRLCLFNGPVSGSSECRVMSRVGLIRDQPVCVCVCVCVLCVEESECPHLCCDRCVL